MRAQVLRWSIWAPFYDRFISFLPQRRRAVDLLSPAAGERVLVVGCGTGLDLPLLPRECAVTAIDLTPAMVRRARARAPWADIRTGDAGRLAFPDASFDVLILHLIVAVVPDPAACLGEAWRVLRPGGRAVVLDKFARGRVSLRRRLLNPVARFFGTDLNRNLEALAGGAGFVIVHDEPALFGGLFRIALLSRPAVRAVPGTGGAIPPASGRP